MEPDFLIFLGGAFAGAGIAVLFIALLFYYLAEYEKDRN